jgi:hypothetical protein
VALSTSEKLHIIVFTEALLTRKWRRGSIAIACCDTLLVCTPLLTNNFDAGPGVRSSQQSDCLLVRERRQGFAGRLVADLLCAVSCDAWRCQLRGCTLLRLAVPANQTKLRSRWARGRLQIFIYPDSNAHRNAECEYIGEGSSRADARRFHRLATEGAPYEAFTPCSPNGEQFRQSTLPTRLITRMHMYLTTLSVICALLASY